jgi:mRNA interferase YafQ
VRQIIETNQFKRDYRKIAASGRYAKKDLLNLVEILANDKLVPLRYRDHALIGNWLGYRECHIKPDWILIYKKTLQNELLLIRTGSHSYLF